MNTRFTYLVATVTAGLVMSLAGARALAQDAAVPFNTITAGVPGEAQTLSGTEARFLFRSTRHGLTRTPAKSG